MRRDIDEHPSGDKEFAMSHQDRIDAVGAALHDCGPLDEQSEAYEQLWKVLRQHICTRAECLIKPMGSKLPVRVTAEHSTVELIAAMEWLRQHEDEARAMSRSDLFVKLRGVATRGASGSARAVQSEDLHGITNVSPGNPIMFTDLDELEVPT